MGAGTEQSGNPWDADYLSSAQKVALAHLRQLWSTAAEPTVIRLVGPEHRGKTHLVQGFLESLVNGHEPDEPPAITPSEFPWRQSHDWRAARRMVGSTSLIVHATKDWMWSGCRLAPDVPSDLLGNLRLVALATLESRDDTSADLLETTGEEWVNLAAKTSVKVSLEQVPYLGTVRALADAGRAYIKLKNASSASAAADIARAMERNLTQDLLALLAICRIASPLEGAALPKLLLIIDEAQFLSQAELTGITDVLTADPDSLLSSSSLPDGLKRGLRRLGMPPQFPIVILLVESTSTRGEDVAGPFGHSIRSATSAPSSIDSWVEQLNAVPEGVPVHRLDQFPLFTTDEADRVVAHLEPRISERTRDLVVARSKDIYLGGHNIALVRAHLDRLSDLRKPDMIDSHWANHHLPLQLQAEVGEMVVGLSREARSALLASSLLGFGFAGSSVDELLEVECSPGLVEADERGLIAQSAPPPEGTADTYYLYADGMTHSYVYELAASDRDLSLRALDRNLVIKARNVLSWAYLGGSPQAMQVAETARGVCWEYRDLAERAGIPDHELARDVWGAALTLTADQDLLFRETGDNSARERLIFLEAMVDEQRSGNESGPAWAMIRRWHIHRRTPGMMTYGSLYAMAKDGRSSENVTRCIPESHMQAAALAGRHFAELQSADDGYGWFDIHLLYRLGPYVRLVDDRVRRQMVETLLIAGTLSPTAVQFLASELWEDADPPQRAVALGLLEGWAVHARRRDAGRAAAILAIRAGSRISDDALQVLEQAFTLGPDDGGMFSDFEGTGALRVGTAPMVYPWLGSDVVVPYALLHATEYQSVSVRESAMFRRLWGLRESHPSAVALLRTHFSEFMSRSKRRQLDQIGQAWMQTHLIGHGEQSTLPVLLAR